MSGTVEPFKGWKVSSVHIAFEFASRLGVRHAIAALDQALESALFFGEPPCSLVVLAERVAQPFVK